MKKTTRLVLLFLFALMLQHCENDDFDSQNDDDSGLTANDIIFQSENFGTATTGNFMGLVTNENGEKLVGVQVSSGNALTTTDQNGIFILKDIDVFENFAYIKASKDGYIQGSRVVVPKINGVNRINIALFKNEATAIVSSGENSFVSLPNGVKVGFTGDFISSDGSEYNGQVQVVLNSIQPNLTATFTQMPGSLFAQTLTNNAVNLETYGMFSVNLLSPSGESLNINKNIPASIEFPISADQVGIAPDTIPLWYFDDAVGYWKEEGQAVKSNNKYFGLVSHFTWWNYDIPFDAVTLCLSINSDTSEATTPYNIAIKRNTNNQLIYSGTMTSQDGLECGLVPVNEDVTVSVYSTGVECNFQLVHEQVITGMSSDSSVNISFSEEFQTTTITGNASNCDGNPLTNGYIYIDDFNTYNITDGIIDIGLQHCYPVITQIQIFDYETSQWAFANDIMLNGETIDIGALSTCENTGGTFNGDITLSSQAEVNDFGQFNYAYIVGDIRIGDLGSGSTDVIDLSPLESLVLIDGSLRVYNNPDLQSFNGLNNLETISNGLFINSNASLISITGFDSLNSINFLIVSNNPNLESIGLDSVTTITGQVTIENNDSLTTLDGLNNVSFFVTLKLQDNEILSSISGLSNLTNLFRLFVVNNNSLTNFEGLEQLTTLDFLWIYNNAVLSDLTGLDNVNSMTPSTGIPNVLIGYGIVTDIYEDAPNPNLTDFCALENLFVNGNGSSLEQGVDFLILNNGYNPTIQDIMDGNCSQ